MFALSKGRFIFYIRGWAGQALVAEVVGVKSESMDLFRHCTFLGPEPESARGYGDWICRTMAAMEKGEKVETHNKYILEKMFGVVVGVDSIGYSSGSSSGSVGGGGQC